MNQLQSELLLPLKAAFAEFSLLLLRNLLFFFGVVLTVKILGTIL